MLELPKGRYVPPFPSCSASQEYSFARESTVKRWPSIILNVVSEFRAATCNDQEQADDQRSIVMQLETLISDVRNDQPLRDIVDDGGGDVEMYNVMLRELGMNAGRSLTWMASPWLYAECYLYRYIRSILARSTRHRGYDPFAKQKLDAFRSSGRGVHALAASMQKLVELPTTPSLKLLHTEFEELCLACLWGNATDLSLLTSLTTDDIQALQSVERGKDYILRNDLDETWRFLSTETKGRVDFILDNSGFELFTDLCFADWLITRSPFARRVKFHPKALPWFVSDVTFGDTEALLESLSDPSFFAADTRSEDDRIATRTLVTRWRRYFEDGVFEMSIPLRATVGQPVGSAAFWTSPLSYCDLPMAAPELLDDLQQSSLVIFKGDLNYRKLTSDCWWPTTTPFETALGPLAGKLNILSLRTLKADVCVGLKPGMQESLDDQDPSWRRSGKYAVISFLERSRSAA